MQKVKSVLSTVYKTISTVVGWAIKHGNILIPILSGVVSGFLAFNAVSSVLTTVDKFQKDIDKVKDGVKATQSIFKALFTADPAIAIALIVAAVVTAVVLIIKNWDKIKAKAQELWGSVKAVFRGIRDSIVGAFDAAKAKVTGVIDWIQTKIGAIGTAIEKVPVLGALFKGAKAVYGAVRKVTYSPIAGHATGTSYFSGGQTRINEGGRGEIVNLPSGTQIIPHDVSKKTFLQNGRSIVLYFIIQGNVIGNRAFMEQCGKYATDAVIKALDRV